MRFIPLMVYLNFIPFKAYSECNWSDIKKNPDNSYTYTKELHLCVGNVLEELDTRKQQLENTKRIITLKDLAIQDYERNVTLWKNTSTDLNNRLEKIEDTRSTDKTIYFVLGILTSALSVYGASKLVK